MPLPPPPPEALNPFGLQDLKCILEKIGFFQDLFDAIPVQILVKCGRPESFGKVLIWNRCAETNFGISATKAVGAHVDLLLPEAQRLGFALKDHEAFEFQKPIVIAEEPVQSLTCGTRWLRTVKTPIFDEEDKPLALLVVSQDITASRTGQGQIEGANGNPHPLTAVVEDGTEKQKKLITRSETQDRWQLALDATDAGVWDWKIQSGDIFLSERLREIVGVGATVDFRKIEDLKPIIASEDVESLSALMTEHLERKTDLFRGEFRIVRSDGSTQWLQARGKAHFDDQGNPFRAIGTVMDISLVKAAKEQMALAKESAESASTAKGDFLAMMSHEIRTPLNGVLGFADLLAESKLTDQQREFLQTIRDSGGTLLAILNDILDYSKIEAGKLDVDLKPTDIRQIVQSLLAFFHPQAEKRGLELRLQIHSSVPSLVLCDPVRVRQIILNLMGNALKFTSKGFVEFDLGAQPSTRTNFTEILFYIRDTGIGISESDQGRLFEPFNQLDASTSRRFGGTGLGLSIVKRLIEIMGGNIHVESQIAEGTTFRVMLPCELVHVDYDPRRTMLIQLDVTPDFAKRRPLNILVAEDNLVNRKLARLLLQKFGYVPDEAEDGSRAVAMSLEKSYDLILMDIQMPGMDGYEAAERIRELCATPPRIVALTAHALKSDEERSRERGLDGHLSKPIRADHLRAVLEKAARAVQKPA